MPLTLPPAGLRRHRLAASLAWAALFLALASATASAEGEKDHQQLAGQLLGLGHARRLFEEDGGGEDEEEEEENLRKIMPDTYVATIVAILTFLIAVSIFFEVAKETIEEGISPELKPTLTSLFGELTVLGFIGIVLFFTFKLPAIQELNVTLYGEPNAINEMSETVHMALFLVMCIFLGTDLLLVRGGQFSEASWRTLRENIWNHPELVRESKLALREARHHTSTWDKLREGWASHGAQEEAIFVYLRQRLFRQKADQGVNAETFDLSQYLAACQGKILGELIEIPKTTWGLLEVLIVLFAVFTLQCPVTGQIVAVIAAAYAIPLVLHLVDCKCRAILVETVLPEVEADLGVDFTREPSRSPSRGRGGSKPRGGGGGKASGAAAVAASAAAAATEKSAILGFGSGGEAKQIEAHVGRFWLGSCKWWPFDGHKDGEEEWESEFMLGLIRKCLLFNSIYITLFIGPYGKVLLNFAHGKDEFGEEQSGTDAEGEGESEAEGTAPWPAHVALTVLAIAWLPVFITIGKLVTVTKNFVMASSLECFLNNRFVLLVMRRVQTRSAFLVLKLTEIMKRQDLMRKAATASKDNVVKLSGAEQMAYRKAFEQFDSGGDGAVSHQELTNFLVYMEPNMDPGTIKEIVELLDSDKSNEVDFDEFIDFIGKVMFLEMQEPHGRHEILKGMFGRVDFDGSGDINVEELCTYLRKYFEDMSVDDTYALIEDFGIDEDGSGELNFEEFEELCNKLKIFLHLK